MNRYTLDFNEISLSDMELVGGKALCLAALGRIKGVTVPSGFCVTTDAYKEVAGSPGELGDLLDASLLVRRYADFASSKVRSL